MNRSTILVVLSVCLHSITAGASDIECYSDVTTSGVQKGKHCQVSFQVAIVNGCPVISAKVKYSAVGLKPYFVDKAASKLVNLDNCRFDGDRLVCNCESNRCNKDNKIIWNIVLNTKFELSDVCVYSLIDSTWKQVKNWTITEDNDREKPHTVLYCVNSNAVLSDIGDYCVADFAVLPGTCYVNSQPILGGRNFSEVECIGRSTVRVTCNTDNCNGELDNIMRQIEDGMSVSDVSNIPNCKQQLIQTIGPWMSTTPKPTTKTTLRTTARTTPTTTTLQTTTRITTTTTTKLKTFKCLEGWAMSRRPVTNPYCFKVFDAPSTIKGYNTSEAFCMNEHKARLATHEYPIDVEALKSTVSSNNFATFLAGRNLCETLPCTSAKFAWHTMDGQWVPIDERPMLMWGEGDPNQVKWNQPHCKGVEACMVWANVNGEHQWVDAICDCLGIEEYLYHITKVACMKEAFLA